MNEKMKDDIAFNPIADLFGFLFKMYSLKIWEGWSKKTAKGIKACVLRKGVTHSDYLKILEEHKQSTLQMKLLRSANYQVTVPEVTKV